MIEGTLPVRFAFTPFALIFCTISPNLFAEAMLDNILAPFLNLARVHSAIWKRKLVNVNETAF